MMPTEDEVAAMVMIGSLLVSGIILIWLVTRFLLYLSNKLRWYVLRRMNDRWVKRYPK